MLVGRQRRRPGHHRAVQLGARAARRRGGEDRKAPTRSRQRQQDVTMYPVPRSRGHRARRDLVEQAALVHDRARQHRRGDVDHRRGVAGPGDERVRHQRDRHRRRRRQLHHPADAGDPHAGRRGSGAQQPAPHAAGGRGHPALQRQHRRGRRGGQRRGADVLPHRAIDGAQVTGRLAGLHLLRDLRRRTRPADQPGRDRDRPPGRRSSAGTSPTSCSARSIRSTRRSRSTRRALPRRRRPQEEGVGVRQLAGQLRDHLDRQLPEDVRVAHVRPAAGGQAEAAPKC